MSVQQSAALKVQIKTVQAAIAQENSNKRRYDAERAAMELVYNQTKARREGLKLELREKLREKSEVEERCEFELNLYKVKVKQLLAEQSGELSQHTVESETIRLENSQRHRVIEAETRAEGREVIIQNKELQTSHLALTNVLHEEQEEAIMKMREDYERKAEQLKAWFEKRMRLLREKMEAKKKEEITIVESVKTTEIADILEKNKLKLDEMKKYFGDLTHSNLEMIKNLKEEVGDMKKKEMALTSDVNSLKHIFAKSSAPLEENKRQLQELERKLQMYKLIQIELKNEEKQWADLDAQVHKISWEVELKKQRLEMIGTELYHAQQQRKAAVFEQKQKLAFNKLLLDRAEAVQYGGNIKLDATVKQDLMATVVKPKAIVMRQ